MKMIFVNENIENQQFLQKFSSARLQSINNALQEIGVKVELDQDKCNSSVISCLEALVTERENLKKELMLQSQESSRIDGINMSLEKEKESLGTYVENLKRELLAANNRTSTLVNEQRELRNHWMAEKADLQSRLCQVQTLNTQFQGSLKKKEKEFDKLQSQLLKLVKDSTRGMKSTILISAPPKKVFSQESNGVTLRDAEVVSLKRSLLQYQQDNEALRNHVEAVKTDLADLQSNFEKKMMDMEEKHKLELDTIATKTKRNITITDCIDPQTPAPQHIHQPHHNHSLELKSVTKVALCKTPGTIARKYLEGTPGVRQMNWIIAQANTEIKALRSRVDVIVTKNMEFSTGGSVSQLSNLGGEEAMAKIVNLRARLTEALLVIEEQDRLIHEGRKWYCLSIFNHHIFFSEYACTALLGKLPMNRKENIEWEVEIEDDVFQHSENCSSVENNSAANQDYVLPPGALYFKKLHLSLIFVLNSES